LKCIKSRHVKEIFCSVRSPGRRVVEFVVRLRNVPGAIAKVSKALALRGSMITLPNLFR